jgi:hypothetical protein
MADLGIKVYQSYCFYCRNALLNKVEKNQGHHNTCKYEITQYKEELGYWYYLQMVNATTDDCITDQDGRILVLNLGGKGLADIPELPFKDIEELDLSYNHLDRVPKWIFKLPHLKKAIFPGNGFSQTLLLDMLKLNEIGVEVESTGLKFKNNILKAVNITYIGSYFGQETLELTEEITRYFRTVKKTNIAYNSLSQIPEWVFKIKGLEEINHLTGNEIQSLTQIRKLKLLKMSPGLVSRDVEKALEKLEVKGIIVTHYESRYF